MAEFQFGKDGVVYYSATLFTATSGSGSASTLLAGATEFDKVRDVTLAMQSDYVDPTTRALAKSGWKSEVPTTRSAQVDFVMNWIDNNTICEVIRDSMLNNSEIAIAALTNDRASSGAQGLCGNFIASFTMNQPIGDVITCDVSLRLSSMPHWHEVT